MNWTPIVKKYELEILKILIDIRESIESTQKTNNNLFLSRGTIGNILFLIYHDLLLNKTSNFDLYYSILNNKLSTANANASFMGGLSGVSWFYYFLANNNFAKYNKEFEKSLKDIDELIKPSINLEAAKRNIDLFNGLNGFAEYLIERGKYYNNYQDLYNLIKNYKKISINDENGTRRVDNRKHFRILQDQNVSMPEILFGEEVNLGLAHGMIGTIIILSKIFEVDVLKIEIKKMLMNSIKWLLKQKKDNSNQLFPSIVHKQKYSNPKIGWCYGDLGVAYSITFAGKKMRNRELVNIGIDIALKSSKYTKINAEINSPYFCHGAAGIAHIYNRFYHLTRENHFLDQSLYWYDILIEMYHSTNKIGGYFNDNENFSYGMQYGIAGIGMVLISGLSMGEPKWDRCFLLS